MIDIFIKIFNVVLILLIIKEQFKIIKLLKKYDEIFAVESQLVKVNCLLKIILKKLKGKK